MSNLASTINASGKKSQKMRNWMTDQMEYQTGRRHRNFFAGDRMYQSEESADRPTLRSRQSSMIEDSYMKKLGKVGGGPRRG